MKNETVRAMIYIVVRLSFLVMALLGVTRGNFEAMAVALVGLALSVVPQLLSRKFKIHLPLFYELVVIGFVVASIMLGELFDAYSSLWWWDSMLHLSSGVIIGYIGFMILFTLHMQGKLNVSAATMAFLTFSVSMAIAAVWEVVEFTIDQVYGASMQHGNFDTMKDIILAMIGSLVATAAAYWHHRWPESSPLRGELVHFFRKNRHLLPKDLKVGKLSKKDLV